MIIMLLYKIYFYCVIYLKSFMGYMKKKDKKKDLQLFFILLK